MTRGRLRERYDALQHRCPAPGAGTPPKIVLPDATMIGASVTPEEYMQRYLALPVDFIRPGSTVRENLVAQTRVYVNSTTPRGAAAPNFRTRYHSNFTEMQALQRCIPNSCNALDEGPIANPSYLHLTAMRHVLAGQAQVHEMQIYLSYALSFYDASRGRGTTPAGLEAYCSGFACTRASSGDHRATNARRRPARLGLDCFGIIRAFLMSSGRIANPIASIPSARQRAIQANLQRTAADQISANDVIIWDESPSMRSGHIAIISGPPQGNTLRVVQSAESTRGLDAADYTLTRSDDDWTLQRTSPGGSSSPHSVVIAAYQCLSPE